MAAFESYLPAKAVPAVATLPQSQHYDYRSTVDVTSQSGKDAGASLAVAIALVGVLAFARKRERTIPVAK